MKRCAICAAKILAEAPKDRRARVLHYKGFVNGKRLYERHKLEINGNNGNQQMEINKSEMSIFNQNKLCPDSSAVEQRFRKP